MQEQVDFGFRRVESSEKAPLVRGVFDNVSNRYDLMNDLMSGGLHRLWKNDMVAWLNPQAGMSVIDVAGGTGDIAMRIRAKADCRVAIMDINHLMLENGRNRAINHNILTGVEWICADAEALPSPDNSFDAYTIAFGIRNVTYVEKALAEAFRVLKPGGRFLCLEFSTVPQPWLQKLYDLYSFNVIPRVGQIITGSADSYQYLVESIRKFPKQDAFAEMMRAAGFGNVQYRNMTQGVVALHSGRKL
jgi:demethylmenaquinone methyltransferase / 2-methoxy-6-polyprenyl-1,4-benzoquinol methylase